MTTPDPDSHGSFTLSALIFNTPESALSMLASAQLQLSSGPRNQIEELERMSGPSNS
jgi:hypothetical protein